ncbi:MAG TPA: polyprenyl synthetase family protein [Anaerolineales bacterium]
MSLETLAPRYRQAIESELRQVLAQVNGQDFEGLHHILAYHLGWEGEAAGAEAGGKRIRPLLLLLTCAAAGGQWGHALPAAAGVELLHNFSLIHDDIQDNSPLRRGRATVWSIWGIAQAINAGDAMFTLAHLAMLRLEETTSAPLAIQAYRLIQETSLHLTQGQYLDLAYESRGDLTLDAYWPMVKGKTAALLSACTEIGALVARASPGRRAAYRQFGSSLGLAFQVQDDLLGIWGNSALTGKSAQSDLLSGKKSLPVLYGLSQNGPFTQRWCQGEITPADLPALADQLEREGARDYTQETANRLTDQALATLETAGPEGEAGEALVDLAHRLLRRKL